MDHGVAASPRPRVSASQRESSTTGGFDVADDDVEEGFQLQDERRAHDRSRLILDIFFDGQDVTGVASTKDISPGGLYMNTQASIPEGAFLMVRIPFSKDVQVVCNAEVIYSNPGQGVGLKFHDVPDEVRATLEREVTKNE
jgi:hypothetical protein